MRQNAMFTIPAMSDQRVRRLPWLALLLAIGFAWGNTDLRGSALVPGWYAGGSMQFIWPKLDKEFAEGMQFTNRSPRGPGYAGRLGYGFAPVEGWPLDGGRAAIDFEFLYFGFSNSGRGILNDEQVEGEALEVTSAGLFGTTPVPGHYAGRMEFDMPVVMINFNYEYEFLEALTWWTTLGVGPAFPYQRRRIETPMGSASDERHDIIFVGQVKVGLRYYINHWLSVEGGYRFFTTSGPGWNFGDGVIMTGNDKIRAQAVEGGFRLQF